MEGVGRVVNVWVFGILVIHNRKKRNFVGSCRVFTENCHKDNEGRYMVLQSYYHTL